TLQRARSFVAMAGAELAIAQRQVAERAHPLLEDLDVAGAAHRLQGMGTLAVAYDEHLVAEVLPVAARLPQRAIDQLRRADLAKAGAGHAGADMVLDDAVEREAARVPEHHARRLILLMEKVEAVGDGSMVVVVHAVLRWCECGERRSWKSKGPVR